MFRRRFAIGLFFVLHGLVHIAPGTAAQGLPHGISATLPGGVRVALATVLLIMATAGFIAAGLGVWGIAGLRTVWGPLTSIAVIGSVSLLAFYGPPTMQLGFGLALDAFALALSGAFSVKPHVWKVTR